MITGTRVAFSTALYLGGAAFLEYPADPIAWGCAAFASILPDLDLPSELDYRIGSDGQSPHSPAVSVMTPVPPSPSACEAGLIAEAGECRMRWIAGQCLRAIAELHPARGRVWREERGVRGREILPVGIILETNVASV